MKRNILIIALIAFTQTVYSQVSAVKYSLKYNQETCLFDCYLNVEEGHSKLLKHRAQFNSQITVVAPKGSYVSVEENYMPLKDNQEYRSSKSTTWEETSFIDAPAITADLSYHSFTPTLSPTSFYNDLQEGDEIKLFSISVDPMVDCASDVRLFENGIDPNSAQKGMEGGDFRNGFTMGGINQIYLGNKELVLPTAPVVENFKVTYGHKVNVDFTVNENSQSACQKGATYQWFGPNGLIASGKEVPTLTYQQANSGSYSLRVTDNIGCVTERVIKLNSGVANTDKTLEGNTSSVISSTIEEDKLSFQSSVFPNPAFGFTNIKIEGGQGSNVTAELTGIDGKVLKTNLINTKLDGQSFDQKIDLNNIAPGMYSIALYLDGEKANTHKLLIIE